MFVSIVIIASANTATGNISNTGRVVRLVRLVKFVRLYRLILERRRIQQYDEFLQELINTNEIDFAEVCESIYNYSIHNHVQKIFFILISLFGLIILTHL